MEITIKQAFLLGRAAYLQGHECEPCRDRAIYTPNLNDYGDRAVEWRRGWVIEKSIHVKDNRKIRRFKKPRAIEKTIVNRRRPAIVKNGEIEWQSQTR